MSTIDYFKDSIDFLDKQYKYYANEYRKRPTEYHQGCLNALGQVGNNLRANYEKMLKDKNRQMTIFDLMGGVN